MTPSISSPQGRHLTFAKSDLSFRPEEHIYLAILILSSDDTWPLQREFLNSYPEKGPAYVDGHVDIEDEECRIRIECRYEFYWKGRPGDDDLYAKVNLVFHDEAGFERFRRFVKRYAVANGLRFVDGDDIERRVYRN